MLYLLLRNRQSNKRGVGQNYGAALAAFLILLFAPSLYAQQSQIGAQAINVQPLNQVGSPARASAVSDFENGSTTRYYWIIAHNGGQTSSPTSTSDTKGPVTLSNVNGFRVTITWTITPSTTYDVLESSTATLPNSLTCGCAVVTNTTNGSVIDTGSYSAYSTLPLKGFNFVFTSPLDGSGNPEVLVTYQNQTSPLCIFSGGTLICGGGAGSCATTNAILYFGGCGPSLTYTPSSGLWEHSETGNFDNTANHFYSFTSIPSSCAVPGGNNTIAVVGSICVPATGAANSFGVGVAGFATNNATTLSCALSPGNCEGIGVYGDALSTNTNAPAWGGAFAVGSTVGQPTTLRGVEVNPDTNNTGDVAYGVIVAPFGSASATVYGYDTVRGGSNLLTNGFRCESATVTNNYCFYLPPEQSSGQSNSQFLVFDSFNGTSHVLCGLQGVFSLVAVQGDCNYAAPAFISNATNPATAGVLQLANTDCIDWRNAANSANLPLCVNGTNQLTFNGGGFSSTNGGTTTSAGTCPTAGTAYATCTVIVPLFFTEPDTNYAASCTVAGTSAGNPWVYQITKGTASITVTISNLSGALATASTPSETDCTVTGT